MSRYSKLLLIIAIFEKARCAPQTSTTTTIRCNRSSKKVDLPVEQITSRIYGCDLGFFTCLDGGCVSQSKTCDGHHDCGDGSDESRTICPNHGAIILSHNSDEITTRSVTPHSIDKSKNNGKDVEGNVDNKQQSNDSEKWHERLKPCEIPPHPRHGHWKLHRSLCGSNYDCEAPSYSGTMGPGTYLVYDCDEGYRINGNRDVFCGPGGNWIKEPTCDEIKCKYLSDSATEAICLSNNVAVSCEIPVPINTSARLRCREGFVQEITYNSTYKNVTCQSDGTWSPEPIKCSKKPKRVKLVLEGNMSLMGDGEL